MDAVGSAEGRAEADCEETEEAWEGTFWEASEGVVVDEADGMNTPQTVGDERLGVDKNRSAPREEPESDDEARKGPAESRGLMGGPMVSVREGPGCRPADILIHFVGILIPLEVEAPMRPFSPRIRDVPERNPRYMRPPAVFSPCGVRCVGPAARPSLP